MNSANAVAEIQLKLLNERAFSSGESCTCKYVTLLQSFRRVTLSIHWYIAQNFWPTFSMSVLFIIYKYILYIYIYMVYILSVPDAGNKMNPTPILYSIASCPK